MEKVDIAYIIATGVNAILEEIEKAQKKTGIIIYPVKLRAVPKVMNQHLEAICEYLHDEEENYKEDPAPDHIWLHVKAIKDWIEQKAQIPPVA